MGPAWRRGQGGESGDEDTPVGHESRIASQKPWAQQYVGVEHVSVVGEGYACVACNRSHSPGRKPSVKGK